MYNIKARCVVGLICTYITLNSLLYISQNQHLHGKKKLYQFLIGVKGKLRGYLV